MPRIGRNPMKSAGRPYQPARVTLVTAVYIPELLGYWEESLEVLKVCLDSVHRNTATPFDLLVFDNGSCPPVREYLLQLQAEGSIGFLTLSGKNVGKVGCWNITFPAAPGEYIAWFDSDVLFRPGWLEESLQVFQTFDNVGMVTGRPGRLPVPIDDDILSATLDWAAGADGDIQVERGDLIPREIIAEHFRSLGVEETQPGFPESDCRITRNETAVYAYASHFQFVSPTTVARQILPLPLSEFPLAGDREWDIRLNKLGYLRLALSQPLVSHLGNHLADELRATSSRELCGGHSRGFETEGKGPRRDGWFAKGIPRRIVMRVYESLGRLLYPTK